MKKINKFLFLIIFCAVSAIFFAQDLNNPAYGPTLQQRQMQAWHSSEWLDVDNIGGQDVDSYWKGQKYYAALAVKRTGGGKVGWSAGYRDKNYVTIHALKACGTDCVVIGIFANTCAMLAELKGNKDSSKIFLAMDRNPERAIDKAYDACELQNGVGNCRYTQREQGSKQTAFCTGYEYGVFSRK